MQRLAVGVELNEHRHTAPEGHPENAERLRLVADALEKGIASGGYLQIGGRIGDEPLVWRLHHRAYADRVRDIAARGGDWLDLDTYVTPGSYEATLRVLGLMQEGIDLVLGGEAGSAYICGRPPGHHAEAGQGMGFCLFNSVALGAEYALTTHGLERVAILDFDVHHGNGTQQIFEGRADVLFISSHQFPHYPGTGAAEETGNGAGAGTTLNMPLSIFSDGSAALDKWRSLAIPALESYAPELILVSAGYDAHTDDPLAQLGWDAETYRELGALVRDAAERTALGRIIAIHEGGYNPSAVRESTLAFIEGISRAS